MSEIMILCIWSGAHLSAFSLNMLGDSDTRCSHVEFVGEKLL